MSYHMFWIRKLSFVKKEIESKLTLAEGIYRNGEALQFLLSFWWKMNVVDVEAEKSLASLLERSSQCVHWLFVGFNLDVAHALWNFLLVRGIEF